MDWSSLLSLAAIGLVFFLMMRHGGGCCGGGHSRPQGPSQGAIGPRRSAARGASGSEMKTPSQSIAGGPPLKVDGRTTDKMTGEAL